jgi:Holliday junction resolvase RusA-like endonuclease
MTLPIPDIPDLHGEMWIPFMPTAKGRPRLSKFGGAFTPKKTREAERFIREYVHYHHVIKEPIPYPLAISIRFFFKGEETAYHCKRPDLDNLVKLVADSLGPHITTYLGVRTQSKGILYNDDCQIVSLMADKYVHPIQGIWVRWRTMRYPFTVKHPLEPECQPK